MFFFNTNKPSKAFWPLSLAGTVIAIGATKTADFDIWWHLKTGEVITRWSQVPNIDIYSYTAAGKQWINHEWLFEVIAWRLYDTLGIAALTALQLIITICISLIVFRTFSLLIKSRSAALWGTLLTLIAVADRVMARPHLFSMLLLALFAMQLHLFVNGKRRRLWELPLLTLVWINLHAGGILAPQVVMAFALGESIQAFLAKHLKSDIPTPIDTNLISHLWIIGALCIAACAVNPQGLEALTFPFKHLGMETILAQTQEWLPTLDPRIDGVVSQIIFRIVLVATPISYILGRKSVRFSHIMLSVMTGFLIMQGKRFTPDFVIINLPVIFFNFKETARRVPVTAGVENLRNWAHLMCITMISIFFLKNGIPATIDGGTAGELGTGSTEEFAPSELIDFLDKNEINGKVFNEMGSGGYLIFKKWPSKKVFIDGRTPVYGDDFFREYTDAFRNARNFEKLDEKYKFDYLVFNSYQAWNLRHFHRYLWDSPTWRLVFANSSGFVYLRDEPKFNDLIKRLELKKNPLIEEMRRAGEIPPEKHNVSD